MCAYIFQIILQSVQIGSPRFSEEGSAPGETTLLLTAGRDAADFFFN